MSTATQPFYIVAVHGGAGVHSPASDTHVKKTMKIACRKALLRLQESNSALDAVQEAVSSLEDDDCLNAGYGSNLTSNGTVECDASIMCGTTGAFGSVGAASGIKHPVKLARSVLEYSRRPDPLGRIAPLMLVADGALQFARSQGIAIVPPGTLVTPRAKEEWERWTTVLNSVSSSETIGGCSADECPVLQTQVCAPSLVATDHSSLHDVQDTVGAVACDAEGSFSAGVSSGGLLLKHPGRIGEAAMYGSGCWAAGLSHGDVCGAACSVSGAGEHITRAALARSVVEALEVSDVDTHETIRRMLLDNLRAARHGQEEGLPQAGILLLIRERVSEGTSVPRLWCAFTTESMAIAYASSLDPKPKALILRRPRQQKTETPIYLAALPLTRG
ncbi:nucleophile aminohydrolase [Rhodofomes roseus]|uniref:Nucleophile aminohydrolase n=1 Tax=Rhodofomes roseus TaxID=34475 RepID=A0ABQ8K5B6_9APHY|nr:nucleophile aminohydrolase [Rhodofomes roseus]KAH9832184.1 nucleophile aminohydrolase [Rhodofomes roseus]